MFHWEILLLPLIAFGVWVLSTVFKPDERNQNRIGARGPEGALGRRIPRRAKVPDRGRVEPVRRRDVPGGSEPLPTPTPLIITPRPPVTGLPGVRRRAPVVATVIDEPPVVRQQVSPVLDPLTVSIPPPPPASALRRDGTPSPVIQEVRRLLSSPKTAAAAFVIREIMERPYGPRRR